MEMQIPVYSYRRGNASGIWTPGRGDWFGVTEGGNVVAIRFGEISKGSGGF